MTLNRSPESMGAIVQTVYVEEIQCEPAWALISITSDTTCHALLAANASAPSAFEEGEFSIFSYALLRFKPRTTWID